jgi:hypothetical protein
MADATMLTRAPSEANAVDRLAGSVLSVGSGLYARFAVWIGVAAFSLYVLLVAFAAIVLPDTNWDMLPYIAVAEEGNFPNPQALHDYAYGVVKSGVSAGDYLALTDDGGGYRTRMASDAAAFHSMLPMYRVKFLYAETLSALNHVMSPVAAMRAVQAVSALLFGAVMLLWMRSAGALALAPIMAAALMVAEFPYAARSNTPDMLCSALLLGGLYAYMRQRQAATAILLLLAVLVRPDNVIFVGVFAVLLIAFRQWNAGVVAGALASFAAYFAISHWAGHPGWWPHLYFSSVEQQMNMDGFDPAFSVVLYAKAFVNAVVRSLTFNTWVGVAVLALAGWYATDRAGFKLDRRAGILFAALVLAALAKFVVFPIHDNRIYFPNLIPPFLLLAGPFMAMWASIARAKLGGETRAGAEDMR